MESYSTIYLNGATGVLALREQLWDAGFRPVPVFNADTSVPSPGKQPLGKEWQVDARRDPPFCATSPAVPHALNTGILADGLRPIDLDIDDPDKARRCAALATAMLGEAPTRTRQGSSRSLMLYRAALGAPAKRTLTGASHTKDFGCKIEVLGYGQQFVAFGRHYPSGADLVWFPEPPGLELRAALPVVTEDQIQTFLEACAPILDAPLPIRPNSDGRASGDPEAGATSGAGQQAEFLRVAEALAAIPNNGPADWEYWNKIGMAIWAATSGSSGGAEAFAAWSARHPAYDPQATAERWQRYRTSPPTQIGAGTLFHLAQEARQTREPPPPHGEGDYGWTKPDAEEPRTEPPPEPEVEAEASLRLVVKKLPNIAMNQISPRQWAYGNFLIFGQAAALGAVDGGGKGAHAVVIALSMITGRALLGEKVWRTGPVAIITYEDDIPEWHRRIAAACKHYGIDYDLALNNFYFLERKPGTGRITLAAMGDRCIDFPDGDEIISTLRKIGAVLLIIDPFNHAHNMPDGNSNTMIAQVAAEANRIAAESGAALLVLHHLRKGASGQIDDLMGATSLRATFRSTRILVRMTADEASALNGIEEHWRYIRLSGSKDNYAPPADKATWYRLESVPLDNGAGIYPDGDNLQVLTAWKPPQPFDGLDLSAMERIFDRLRSGPDVKGWFYSRYSKATHWAGEVIVEEAGKTKEQAGAVLATWIKNGVLTEQSYQTPNKNLASKVLPDDAKVAAMLAPLRAFKGGFE